MQSSNTAQRRKTHKKISPNDQAFIGIALLCPQRDQLAEARDMV